MDSIQRKGCKQMKIVSIDVFALKHRGEHQASLRAVVCRINTDDGVYGYGECGLSYGRGAMAGFHMIKELAPLLIGQDPMCNEYLWERMFKDTFWGQAGGAIYYAAMSAIDMALFDIKGKVLGVPAYQLLGGKQRDTLRCYASQLQLGWVDDDALRFKPAVTPEEYAQEASKAVADGYDAIKTDFFGPQEDTLGALPRKTVDLIISRIRATREAVGPDVDIIIENHSKTDAISATLIGQAAEEYGIMYYEEVATPLNAAVMKNVARKVNIPIANGERLFTRWGYLQFLLDDSIQVVQPDICLCGGITEAKKICDMAHVFDATVQVHVCGSPLTLAASLQLEAAIPNFCIHEHHVINKVMYNRELGKYDYAPINGKFSVPDLPGIGQELSDYALKNAYKETVS
jgi:galactonate dehydratase